MRALTVTSAQLCVHFPSAIRYTLALEGPAGLEKSHFPTSDGNAGFLSVLRQTCIPVCGIDANVAFWNSVVRVSRSL